MEIWRIVKFKNFEHYRISNRGRLKNTRNNYITKGSKINKTDNSPLVVHLCNKSHVRPILTHRLVLFHFKKTEIGKEYGLHIDGLKFNNRSSNLKWATRGDVISNTRRANEIKNNRLRGVYPWKLSSKKWRAILTVGKMKHKVLGYYVTKNEAYKAFHAAYKQKYGKYPFTLTQLKD